MSKVVEIAVKQPLTLRIDEKEYTVEFPLSAVILAETKVGHSLKSPGDWFNAPAKDVPALLQAGLSKHQPEVSDADVQAICEQLGPEGITEITEALGALAFPRFLARYKETLKKLEGKANRSPNEQSGDVL